jgi:hypothetical protein
MVSLLLEHGGNPRRPGRKFGGEAETPIDLAKKREHHQVVEILESAPIFPTPA